MEIRTPAEWEGRDVDAVDMLLFIKRELDKGRPLWLFTGYPTAESLVSFIQGFELALSYNSKSVERYRRFVSWLRDEKHEFPGEGWAAYYLRQHGGDHHAAVMRFLNYVAEFAARS